MTGREAQKFSIAQVELAQDVLPEILEINNDYYNNVGPNPYLDGLADGGLLKPTDETDVYTDYTIVNASGLRDTLMPEEFTKIGYPEDITRNGLLWVVKTHPARYEAQSGANIPRRDPQEGERNHMFAHWDGANWITRRFIPGANVKSEWADRWEPSSPTNEELDAIKITSRQTKLLHEIANVFEGSSSLFELVLSAVADSNDQLPTISRSITLPCNTHSLLGRALNIELKPFMLYHYTGFQALDTYVPIIFKLASGRSFELDSQGIHSVEYHRPPITSTPEMLKKGENIPLRTIHPPVPLEMLA